MGRYASVCIALVAQLDRVQASEAWGRGFDSRRARHVLFNDEMMQRWTVKDIENRPG